MSKQESNKGKNFNIGRQKDYRQEIFVTDYMKKVIKVKDSSKDTFHCCICSDEPVLSRKSVTRHILESEKHKNNFKKEDVEKHHELITKLENRQAKNKEKKTRSCDQINEEKKNYLCLKIPIVGSELFSNIKILIHCLLTQALTP